MSSIIEIEQLTKSFNGIKVLDNLSLSVRTGAVYGFLGNNGAGKSTTIRILLGLLAADSGHVAISQTAVLRSKPYFKQDIGSIIDAPVLYEHLTATEFLGITRRIKGLAKSEITRVLAIVELDKTQKLIIQNYSLGMKQRLAIANALMGKPKLLILDEPTNGLDPQGMIAIRELLRTLPEKTNCTVFLSSHLLDEVEKVATDVGVISQGKLIFQQSLSTLLSAKQGQLSLHVCDAEKAKQVLMPHGYELFNQSAQQVSLENVNQQHCPQIHKLLITNGVELFQSRYQQDSLEQIFQQLNHAH